MKLPYREGTWFAVPLKQSGFAVGVVARNSKPPGCLLCYFFGPRRNSIPTLAEVERFMPNDAIRVFRVGDLHLIKGRPPRGTWPIIGHSISWKRTDWPMPPFVRREPLTNPPRAWRVYLSDTDTLSIDREEPEPYDSLLEPYMLAGAEAAEIMLTKMLAQR